MAVAAVFVLGPSEVRPGDRMAVELPSPPNQSQLDPSGRGGISPPELHSEISIEYLAWPIAPVRPTRSAESPSRRKIRSKRIEAGRYERHAIKLREAGAGIHV